MSLNNYDCDDDDDDDDDDIDNVWLCGMGSIIGYSL